MKNFLEGVFAWKTAAAMMFSASVILCAVIMLFTGEDAVAIPVLASLLLVSAGGTFLQLLAFTDRIIKRMRYTARMAVFAIPFLALLAANAYFFRWFPMENTMYWLTFVGVFLLVFIGGTIAFEVYFRVMGKKYDGLLGQYRKQREAEK
ncbi:MAG: hypothetical protein FWE08_09080 [Oscillospiraceae bacterium]|nr:hypothetical protein [Oscillospiraceae bacterium]